jgi:putative transposase
LPLPEEQLTVRRRGGRKRALGTRAPMSDVPRLPNGSTSRRPVHRRPPPAHPGGGRRLHPRVPYARRRHLDLRHAGRPRARSPARRARQADDHRQRQRHRADQQCHPAMGRRSHGGLALIAPGKPAQNAFAESLIGRLRDELLNETLFRSLAHTRAVLEAWRAD